ncbi:hypothetical protein BKE38_16650 [Pseudoroseomonas deserti]|uniref:Uncharacterized protein n=1 Tax=Teichococcus deserti TaxID=1817963 RepID=A0A1V2H013_9PROT|nr:hypothetical protein [Pseudoroseomonas deserti]ONG51125.1 hypothetical protein BKE38_16650 [Pseudoroseomonas deserti]
MHREAGPDPLMRTLAEALRRDPALQAQMRAAPDTATALAMLRAAGLPLPPPAPRHGPLSDAALDGFSGGGSAEDVVAGLLQSLQAGG